MISTDPPTLPTEVSGELRLVLLWMAIAFVAVFVPLLILAIRRATIGSRRPSRPPRSTDAAVDAWAEAGRRMDAGLGRSRLDDTVDLDPFNMDDEPW